MKKIILALTAVGLLAGQAPRAEAHGGAGIAAAVVGGLAVGTIIGESIAQRQAYYAPAPTYYYPAQAPVVYQAPPPTVVYQQPAPIVYQQPAPGVCQPAPVVVYRQPVYYRPAPVISIGFGYGYGYGYGYRSHGYYRGYR